MTSRIACFCLMLIGCSRGLAVAQQTTVSTPALGVGHRYAENINVQWGAQHHSPAGGFFFRSGGSPQPAFGGFNPSASSTLAFGGRSGGLNWGVRVSASQASSRNMVSTTPSLTIPNGGWGMIYSTVQRPFVTGIVPVVGGRTASPLQERLFRLRFNTAAQATAAEASAAHQAEQQEQNAMREKKPRPRKPDDPPLILTGRSRSHSAAGP